MIILNMMSHVLSEASENIQKYKKEKNSEMVSYWTDIHRTLTHACRDIGYFTHGLNKGKYEKSEYVLGVKVASRRAVRFNDDFSDIWNETKIFWKALKRFTCEVTINLFFVLYRLVFFVTYPVSVSLYSYFFVAAWKNSIAKQKSINVEDVTYENLEDYAKSQE